MNYLGQTIELIQEDGGWVSIWYHHICMIQLGTFPTANAAWDATVELIERDLAVRSLLEVIDDWTSTGLITCQEYSSIEDSLVQFVVAV